MSGIPTRARLTVWQHLLWIVPLGLGLKLYRGPGAWWVNDYAAAVLYELCWIILVFGLFASQRLVFRIPLGVFVATSILECLQLSRAGPLELVRASFLGRALIGTTFDPWDFPVYLASCLLGWWWLRRMWRRAQEPSGGES